LCSGSHTLLAFDPSRVIPEHTNHRVHVTTGVADADAGYNGANARRGIIRRACAGSLGTMGIVAMAEGSAGVSAL